MAAIDTFTSNTYVSDNTGNIPGKTLRTDRFDLEMRAYVADVDTQVPHNTPAVPIIFDVLQSSVENERTIHKSRQKGTAAITAVEVTDKYLNGAWEELKRFAASYTITKTRQANNTLTSNHINTVTQELREHNPANWLSDVISVSAWQTLTRREYDPELGLKVTIVESVVASNTTLSDSTTTVFKELRQVDADRSILTTITVESAFDRSSTETIQFTFPGIFQGYTSSAAFLEPQERTVFQFNPVVRTPFTALVQAGVRDNLVTAAEKDVLLASTPTGSGSNTLLAEIWVAKPIDIQYGGILFSLNIPNVLSDEYSAAAGVGDPDYLPITASTHADDNYYGYPITDTYTIMPSTPTATEYTGLIGSGVTIQDTIKPWKYGLFWRQRVTIELQ